MTRCDVDTELLEDIRYWRGRVQEDIRAQRNPHDRRALLLREALSACLAYERAPGGLAHWHTVNAFAVSVLSGCLDEADWYMWTCRERQWTATPPWITRSAPDIRADFTRKYPQWFGKGES